MFEPIESEKIYKAVMRQVKKLIQDGDLAPGDRLPSERDLAAQLTVSRVSVRQAIAGLEAQGLVTMRQGDGTYIAERQNIDDLVEGFSRFLADEQISPDQIIECRLVVECAATRLCAERATDKEVERLRDLLERRRESAGNTTSIAEMNRDLHLAIADGSRNRAMVKLMEMLLEMMRHNMWPSLKKESEERQERVRLHLDQHESIVEAIALRDPDLAYQRMKEHLESIETEMVQDLMRETTGQSD